MFGRSVRSLCLVGAVWAVLFAPGAFRGDSSAGEAVRDANHLTAAVIAPTFSVDGLHAARPCRVENTRVDVCDVVAGSVPAVAVVALAAGVTVLIGRREPMALLVGQRTTAPRGPPTS